MLSILVFQGNGTINCELKFNFITLTLSLVLHNYKETWKLKNCFKYCLRQSWQHNIYLYNGIIKNVNCDSINKPVSRSIATKSDKQENKGRIILCYGYDKVFIVWDSRLVPIVSFCIAHCHKTKKLLFSFLWLDYFYKKVKKLSSHRTTKVYLHACKYRVCIPNFSDFCAFVRN